MQMLRETIVVCVFENSNLVLESLKQGSTSMKQFCFECLKSMSKTTSSDQCVDVLRYILLVGKSEENINP